jgi:polygalacturonase
MINMSPLSVATNVLLLLGLGHILNAISSVQVDGKTCTVTPLGQGQDDVPGVLHAIQECGQMPGGRVILPAPYTYRINQRMTTHLGNSTPELGGTLLFSGNIAYWVNNSYRIDFQNQSTAWRVTGHDYVVDGGQGKGGIDGKASYGMLGQKGEVMCLGDRCHCMY